MLPKERSETGQNDIFRSRLDQIIDLIHPLAKLARIIDWGYLETAFGEVYADVPGRPPLPTRLMAGVASTARASLLFSACPDLNAVYAPSSG